MEEYDIMADIHVWSISRQFIQKMVIATGLTVHQVRTFREKSTTTMKKKASTSPHSMGPMLGKPAVAAAVGSSTLVDTLK